MQHPCKLFVCAEGGVTREDFTAVAFLADRIHTLRETRPILTHACRVVTHDFAGEAVSVSYGDAGGFIGWAVIGAPEYAGDRQDQLLGGALERLRPERRRVA
jgi:hypothetical protein